ncbi:gastrula zinc finger protein xFG20-1-like [Triplophysa dalaica]|uniref:gastrula zinc finger protein xFG20-1-like n=1 Tax=Triplophysa dalaica TaxID=1582913 RepID=UPI0024E022EE|nr:gastrula zinc finger protein xFG20-1-like [Triplophysa dalaica]
MLGLQETRSSGTPTSKTYSCVACSATFQSLASLLVHQATHADEISCQQESTLPTCVTCGTLFSSADLLEKHNCVAVPTPAAQEMHVCDCGEEFDALSALEEHKMLHKPDEQVIMSLDINPRHLEMELDNKKDSGHPVLDQASPNCSPCHSNEDPLVKSTCSASETDINDMAPTTDTSTVEENVKSTSASEAEIETASITEISIPMKAKVKSASASEADIEMASSTEISIPTKENVKSASASEADIEMASATHTSDPMEENVKSSSSASEADIKMASTTDRSVPMEVDVKSPSSASEAEIKDMASTSDRSIPAEKNILNQQDEDILKPHESLLPHSVKEKEPILENNSDTLESSNTSNHPEHDSEESASSHKESTGCDKKSILKILASAYMSHRQPGHLNQIPAKRNQPPRKVAPRAPMQFAPAITMPKSEPQKKEFNTNCA